MYGVIIIYLMLLGCGIEVLSRSSQTGVVEVKGVDEIMRDESGKKCGARLAHQSVRMRLVHARGDLVFYFTIIRINYSASGGGHSESSSSFTALESTSSSSSITSSSDSKSSSSKGSISFTGYRSIAFAASLHKDLTVG